MIFIILVSHWPVILPFPTPTSKINIKIICVKKKKKKKEMLPAGKSQFLGNSTFLLRDCLPFIVLIQTICMETESPSIVCAISLCVRVLVCSVT